LGIRRCWSFREVERENGRKGEREKGRMGEWLKGRKGERRKGILKFFFPYFDQIS